MEGDEDQDADSLEASLRFPTFARRPITFEGGSEKRKHSPVRSPLTLIELSHSSQSLSQDSALFDQGAKSADYSTNEEEMEEEEVLFSLDDEFQTKDLSGQCYENEAKYDLHTNEEAIDLGEDEEPSSLRLSVVYPASTSQNIRRQSDHSSAADLDMIWDEEEDEGLVSAMDSRTSVDELEKSLGSNANKLSPHSNLNGKQASATFASPRKEYPIAIVGGFHREGRPIDEDDAQKSPSFDTSFFRRPSVRVPLVHRSSSASRSSNGDHVRRLSFARRPAEYNSPTFLPPSSVKSIHSMKRNSYKDHSPSNVSPSQYKGPDQITLQNSATSQPSLSLMRSHPSSPTCGKTQILSNIHGRRVTLPLSASLTPMTSHEKMMSSSSNTSLAAMSVQENARGEQIKEQAHLLYLTGRRRSVTDPLEFDSAKVKEVN